MTDCLSYKKPVFSVPSTAYMRQDTVVCMPLGNAIVKNRIPPEMLRSDALASRVKD